MPIAPTPTSTLDVAALDFAARINEQARQALEKHRKTMLDRCWFPIVSKGGLNQSLYDFVIELDALGEERKREVRVKTNTPYSRADAAECLAGMAKDVRITIPAPGKGVIAFFEVPFP
jgi:hypothetical protein